MHSPVFIHRYGRLSQHGLYVILSGSPEIENKAVTVRLWVSVWDCN